MPDIVKVVVQPIVTEIKLKTIEIQGPRGATGPSGAETASKLILPVTSNGQIQFNIFTDPSQEEYYLDINGASYFEEYGHFSIQLIGLNWRLIWNNQFQITTTDEITFIKF